MKPVVQSAVADDEVVAALVAWGAPLTGCVSVSGLPLEETLVCALQLSHRDPAVLRVLPTVFLRNQARVDMNRLLKLARHHQVTSELGLMVDLVRLLRGVPLLSDEQMPEQPSGPPQLYVEIGGGTRMRALVAQRTLPLARKWGFLMAISEEMFRATADRAGV